jgi:uncharacterized protein
MSFFNKIFNSPSFKNRLMISIFVFISLFFFIFESTLAINYWQKSFMKIALFVVVPLTISYKSFRFSKIDCKALIQSLLLGLIIYFTILGGFVIIQSIISLDVIRESLLAQVNVNRDNFIFVALYISFINSWIEEFFFRGFGYFKIKPILGKYMSMILSSLLFAIYHISIVRDWAHPLLVVLAILGLFFVGIFFILLNERNHNVLSSWMVHMFANLAINTIGLHMFNIIQLPFLN